MTAEGDNSVLMNKVAKEQLTIFKPKKVEMPQFDLANVNCLHAILAQNEQRCMTKLAKTMMNAPKGAIFDTWSGVTQ